MHIVLLVKNPYNIRSKKRPNDCCLHKANWKARQACNQAGEQAGKNSGPGIERLDLWTGGEVLVEHACSLFYCSWDATRKEITISYVHHAITIIRIYEHSKAFGLYLSNQSQVSIFFFWYIPVCVVLGGWGEYSTSVVSTKLLLWWVYIGWE